MTRHLVYLFFAVIALFVDRVYGQSVASSKRPCPGAFAKKGDTIHVHYQGYIDKSSATGQHDKMFDSSLKRGTPFTFKLGAGQVIAGWDKGYGAYSEFFHPCSMILSRNTGNYFSEQ
jgi:hypothetical protein